MKSLNNLSLNNFVAIALITVLMTLSADSAIAETSSVVSEKLLIELVLKDCSRQALLTRFYDPSYVRLDYPMGDIDISKGVCTDVVIRALRAIGVDLQQMIHEDMRQNFSLYPKNWSLKRPDRNIDHRRVPNMVTFFTRKGMALPVSVDEQQYLPGDLVTWKLPRNLDHIGIVSNTLVEGTSRYAIYHNIGAGVQLEDILFAFDITGHFRDFSMLTVDMD